MPQIKEYTAQVDQLRPSETGVEAVAMEGRRIGAFGDQAANVLRQSAGDVARAAEVKARAIGQEDKTFSDVGVDITTAASQTQDFLAHKEIGQLTPVLAKRMLDISDQYQDALSKADPAHADMAIAQFNEQTLEPAFQQLEDSASSPQAKKFVADHINQLREHYYEKQAGDRAQLAGIAVKNGLAQSDNSWSNTAYNDPSQLDGLLGKGGKPGLIDTSITGLVDSNPNLRGVQGQQLKTDMTYTAKVNAVHSAFLGALQKTGDPDGLVKQFEQRYPDYIKPAELAQMATAAKMQTKANTLYTKQTEVAQRQLDEQSVKAAANKAFTDNVTFDSTTGEAKVSPNLIRDAIDFAKKFPDAPNAADHARTIINWAESQQKKDRSPVDDPDTVRALTDGLFDPNKPTTNIDILKADAADKLSPGSRKRLLDLQKALDADPIREPIFKAKLLDVKAQISPRVNGVNLGEPGAYEHFVSDFTEKYMAARRAGTLEPDALDLKNPNSMISKAMAPYKSNVLGGAIAAGGGLNFTSQPTPATQPAKPTTWTDPKTNKVWNVINGKLVAQ